MSDRIAIEFKNVSRVFSVKQEKLIGEVKAVDNVSLEIRDGEFFSLSDLPVPARQPACA